MREVPMDNVFEQGSFVQNKAGGPPMYVLYFSSNENLYYCKYYNGIEFKVEKCRSHELIAAPSCVE